MKEVRDFARMLLRGMVQAGYDPTDPESVGPEMEPWDFVPVCLRLIGWPHDFVRPEHREQFDRLLRQQAEERAVRPRNSDEWDRGAAKALAAFVTRGVPPTDSRYFAYVMTTAEMFALFHQTFPQNAEELLAAFDTLANASVDHRDAALRRICELQVRHHAEGKHARS